jgi:hypothetical protein
MNCREAQLSILEALHNPVAGGVGEPWEQHLASCPACARFQRQHRDLDAELAALFDGPALPAGFGAAVLNRAADLPRVLDPAQIADRKRRIDAEDEALLRRVGLGAGFWKHRWRVFLWSGAASAALAAAASFAGAHVQDLRPLQGWLDGNSMGWAVWFVIAAAFAGAGSLAARAFLVRR